MSADVRAGGALDLGEASGACHPVLGRLSSKSPLARLSYSTWGSSHHLLLGPGGRSSHGFFSVKLQAEKSQESGLVPDPVMDQVIAARSEQAKAAAAKAACTADARPSTGPKAEDEAILAPIITQIALESDKKRRPAAPSNGAVWRSGRRHSRGNTRPPWPTSYFTRVLHRATPRGSSRSGASALRASEWTSPSRPSDGEVALTGRGHGLLSQLSAPWWYERAWGGRTCPAGLIIVGAPFSGKIYNFLAALTIITVALCGHREIDLSRIKAELAKESTCALLYFPLHPTSSSQVTHRYCPPLETPPSW